MNAKTRKTGHHPIARGRCVILGALIVMAVVIAGCLDKSSSADNSGFSGGDGTDLGISALTMDYLAENLPGVYEISSNGNVSILVTDMHRYDQQGDGWTLSLGMALQNLRAEEEALLEAGNFSLLDERGREHSPIEGGDSDLKNPLRSGNIGPGEVALGSISFELEEGSHPLLLLLDETPAVSLDQEVVVPGDLVPLGTRARGEACNVDISGIYRSEERGMIRVDYILENDGSSVMPLEDRAYGRFADLVDTRGISYQPYDYKMLDRTVPPGGMVQGSMVYSLPDGRVPAYLIFWPPVQDAMIFDLRESFLDGPTEIS